uniref:Reverse transcriptase domain-containing protein n=1 Tax=Tanacetum cinerariifolium TaxID=118510 RepID=A0A6L2NQW9_TANCI|nr:reverse transcriptase domain-containing protein [Tanacetum cinerariifolium]
MALLEDHLAKFHKIADAKEMWEAIKSRFGGNNESKKMQKYLLKQKFKGFSVSASKGLHKGYDRFQTLLSQLEIHGAGVSHEDVNQKFLRSLPSSWSQVSFIMITKPGLDALSFDDLYNNLRVFERDVKGTTASSSSSSSSNIHNVAFVSADNTSSTNDINDDDIEEMDLKCRRRDAGYNGNKARDNGRRPAYLDDSKVLVTIDGEDIDWSGHVEEDAQNYAMMVYSSSNSGSDNEESDLENTAVNDRYAARMHAVPPPMIGNYMPSRPDVEIDYSKFTYGPKQTSVDESDSKPSEYASFESASSVDTTTSMPVPVESAPKVIYEPKVWIDAPIIEEYESDSDIDSVSNVQEDKEKPNFAFTESIKHVKTAKENVKETSTPNHSPKVEKHDINGHTRKGLGYAFARKACFVCGSFSNLIRDCDFHEKRMAKQDELTKARISAAKGNWDTDVKASGGCNWRNKRKYWNKVFNYNSGSKFRKSDDPHKALKDKGIVNSGCSKHMTGNKAHLPDYQEFKGDFVAFGGSNGRITGKGKIKAGMLDFEDVYYVEELKHYNLFFESQMCDKKNKVLFTDTDCLVVSLGFKFPDENQVHARLDSKEGSRERTREGSRHSSARTLIARPERLKVQDRLRYNDRHVLNRLAHQRLDASNKGRLENKERFRSIGESYDDSHSSHSYHNRDRSRHMKRRKASESLLSSVSRSDSSDGRYRKSKSKRHKPTDEDDLIMPWLCEEQKKYIKDPVEIHNIKQKDGDTIEDFIEWLKVETGSMKGAPECMRISRFMHGVNNSELTNRLNEHVSKTIEEIMITTTAFIRGEAAAASKKKGKLSHLIKEIKHGRDQSKVGKKETPAKDKPAVLYMIQSWQRMTRKKVTHSFERVKEIMFPPLTTSSGAEGSLVIEAKIGGHMIHRKLLVTIGDADHSTRAWMNFMIVRSLSPYNGIIGRLGIKEIQVVPSTADIRLKFPVNGGIVTIRSTVLIPVEGMFMGYMVTPEGIKPCPDKTEAVLQLPSPRTIKEKCIKKSDFHWTSVAEQAFKQLKQHLSELPLLVAPKPKEELIVYLSASYEAIRPGTGLYFDGKASSVTSFCSQEALEVLADFLAEMPDESQLDASVAETQQEPWTLFMDGSLCVDGSGAGLILTSPEGTEFTYVLKFQFAASNNEVEYEALIAGLRIVARIGVQNVHISVDSKLVANQVLGTYVAKDENMIKYLEKVKSLVNGFTNFSISQVPRSKNKKADALSKIASTSFAH